VSAAGLKASASCQGLLQTAAPCSRAPQNYSSSSSSSRQSSSQPAVLQMYYIAKLQEQHKQSPRQQVKQSIQQMLCIKPVLLLLQESHLLLKLH
jgi:hypothetical protein